MDTTPSAPDTTDEHRPESGAHGADPVRAPSTEALDRLEAELAALEAELANLEADDGGDA